MPAGGLRWRLVEVKGAAAARGVPPLLFLHAFPLHAAMWAPQLAGLAGRARCLAPDLPGFGGTAPLPTGGGLDEYADRLATLLDTLAVEQAVVCGLSMGGYLAFALWRRHPRRVAGVVLADTRAAADSEPARQKRLDLVRALGERGVEAAVEAYGANLLGATTRRRRPELAAQVEGWIRENTPEGIAAAARAMADRPDSTPLLGGLTVPALVVGGEEDTFTPPGEMAALAGALPRAEFVPIPGAGHLSNLEEPERFNGALGSYLDRWFPLGAGGA